MASYETFEQSAACPCGLGTLRRVLYSSNNTFGGSWTGQATLVCSSCCIYWAIDGQDNLKPQAHLRPEWIKQVELDELTSKIWFLQKTISTHIEVALQREFTRLNATTKAAQHRLLQKSNLNAGSYRQYLRDGLRSVVSQIDPDSIIECEDLVKELDSIDHELLELQAQSQQWYLKNKHHLFYKTEWRFSI